jgi:polyhydroxybutyrate depolymerase
VAVFLSCIASCAPDVSLGGNTAPKTVKTVEPQTCALGGFPVAEGRFDRTLAHAGRTRTYSVYVPPAFAPCDAPVKTILVFRDDGPFLRPLLESRGNPFLRRAADEGYLVVVPESSGVGLRDDWNAPLAPRLLANIDDQGFVAAVLGDLPRRDASRTYAIGLGQGGTFLHALAAENGSFAAIAIFGGVLGGRRSISGELELPPSPVAPTSALLVHGTADAVFPFDGGASNGAIVTSFEEAVRFWAQADGCTSSALTTTQTVRTRDFVCPAGLEVQSNVLVGLGHAWPDDTPGLAYVATDVTLAFFGRQKR